MEKYLIWVFFSTLLLFMVLLNNSEKVYSISAGQGIQLQSESTNNSHHNSSSSSNYQEIEEIRRRWFRKADRNTNLIGNSGKINKKLRKRKKARRSTSNRNPNKRHWIKKIIRKIKHLLKIKRKEKIEEAKLLQQNISSSVEKTIQQVESEKKN